MTLTGVLAFLIPLFILPGILLPLNRLRVFSIGTVSAFIPVSFIYLLNHWMGQNFIEQGIGNAFYPVFRFLFQNPEISSAEKSHLSFTFFLLFLYLFLYLILLIFTKHYYVGSNPSFHKNLGKIYKIPLSIVFFLTSYTIVFLFLINIRLILPIQDGLFQDFFSWIYPLEA